MREPQFSRVLDTTIRGYEEHIPNMVSFMGSPIDRAPWENASRPILSSSAVHNMEPSIELDLIPLVRDFLGHITLPVLFGKALLEYHPSIIQDLWTMEYAVEYFIMGVPRWLPIPAVTRAYNARRRILMSLATFHEALDATAEGKDAGPEWRDMSDISEMIMRRHEIFKREGFAPPDRADISVRLYTFSIYFTC